MNRLLLNSLVTVTALFGAASNSSAGNPVIPQAWEGVWAITDSSGVCDMPYTEGDFSPDTLCAGEPYLPPELGFMCTGPVSDTQVNLVCTATSGVPGFPDCSLTTTITLTATRTGETYVATERTDLDFTGTCPPDSCEETRTVGDRTAADPDCMVTPIEPKSWSAIKSVYR